MIPVTANPHGNITSPADLAPLPGPEIYEGLDHVEYDGQGFPSSFSTIFATLVAKHRPKTIIEVGSWKGVSARMWLTAAGPDCRLYCVDTWLTAADAVVLRSDKKDYKEIRQNGHIMTYWTFLKNIKTWGLEKQVTPIVNTSSIGSDVLKTHGITAPIIYIDGDHSYRQCFADLNDYWDLLEPGGSMLVDDFRGYPGVYSACLRFIEERQLWRNHSTPDNCMFCLLEKP